METEILIDGKGNFRIALPYEAQLGETWMIYATDRNGNASRIVYVYVEGEELAAEASSLTAE